jgi:hypothetical protein
MQSVWYIIAALLSCNFIIKNYVNRKITSYIYLLIFNSLTQMSFIYCHLNFHPNLLRPWHFPLSHSSLALYIPVPLICVFQFVEELSINGQIIIRYTTHYFLKKGINGRYNSCLFPTQKVDPNEICFRHVLLCFEKNLLVHFYFATNHFSPDFEGPFRPSRQLSKSSAREKN